MSDKKLVVDVSAWRMGEYSDFFAAGNRNDFAAQFDLIAKIVVDWPYDGDPKKAESYRNLTVAEWQKCLTGVGEAISAQFQRGN